jgi:signal transduction histidine kinase/ActR/RegA family two-component response regulator
MLQATLNSTTDGIAGIDQHGNLTAYNARFLEMWRIPRELAHARRVDAIVEHVHHQLSDPEGFIERQNELYRCFDMEREERLEFKDGRVYEHISKPHWVDNEYVGRICAYKDLTPHLKVEADLNQVILRARCILWVADAERIGDDLVWNLQVQEVDAAQQVIPLDVPPGESYTRVWTAHFHPEDKKRMKRVSRDALLSGKRSYQHDFRCYDQSGNERWLFEDVHIEPNGENRWRATGVCTDITERRRAEEALRQSQKLESLGVLAGGIAHDFNNLLTGILGQTTLALSRLDEDSFLRSYLERTAIAAERAADLTRQLLAYSGRAKAERRPIDLNRLIRDNVNFLGASLDKSVGLIVNLSEGLPLIEGDRGQIQQVVMNLVINAAEAMAQTGGTVTINTRLERLEGATREFVGSAAPPSGDYAVVEVSDTGVGIDGEILERIFDPFFTTKKTGKGLGLSATQGIIQAHQGGLSVKSATGEGSTFTVYFPVDASLAEPLEAARKRTEALRGRVLIIDHEELVREVARDILESAGLTTLIAATGKEGVDLFLAHRGEISAALLDMQLPLMSGWETLRRIRSIDPVVRFILLSGQEEAVSATGADGAHTQGVLTLQKPFTYERLLEKVEEALQPTDGRGEEARV